MANFTTTEVRFSYLNVFSPKEDQSGKNKYSVTCLLPKTDVDGYNALMAVVKEVAAAESNSKLKGISIDHVKNPVHDGDGVSPNGKTYGDECKGHWVFTASASEEHPPQVLDQGLNPIMDKTAVYSGCYGHAAISIYAYSNSTQGIGFGLNAILKTRDGEALGYKFNADSAFGHLKKTNPAQPQVDPITGVPL